MNINGRFGKVATTDNSIVVGLIGSLTSENIAHDDILRIASFYGAKSRGCKLPTNNYNGFIEIFA